MPTPVYLHAVDYADTANTRASLAALRGSMPQLAVTDLDTLHAQLASQPAGIGRLGVVLWEGGTLPRSLAHLPSTASERCAWLLLGPDDPSLQSRAEQAGYLGYLPLDIAARPLAMAVQSFQHTAAKLLDQHHRRQTLATTNERLQRLVDEQLKLTEHAGALDKYLDAVATAVLRLTPADGSALELVEGNELVYRAAGGSSASYVGFRLSLDESLSGQCVRADKALDCPDTETDPRVARLATRKLGIRSMLVAPLPGPEGALGVIKASAAQPYAFGDLDGHILQLLAEYVASALLRARDAEAREALLYSNRQALDSLHRTSAQLRTLVNSSPLPIVGTDLDGTITLWNAAAERLFGWSAAEVLGGPAPYVPESIREHFQSYRQRVMEGETVHVDSQRLTRDGRTLDVRVFASALIGRDNTVEGVVSQVEDISARLSLQRALERANAELEHRVDSRTAERDQRTAALKREARERELVERRFHSIVSNAATGIALVGQDGRFLEVNDKLCEIVGYPRAELLALTFQEITHPADLDADLDQARRLFAGDIDSYTMEKRYQHKNGGSVWISLTASVVRDDAGQATEAVAVIKDIQARKAAEERLRLFERAVQASVDGIVISDAQAPGQPVIYANPAMETITGYPTSAMVGRNSHFLQGNDYDQEDVARLREDLAQGRESRVVLRNYSRDGRRFYNELHVAPIRDRDDRVTHLVAVVSDITDRLEAEKALQEAYESLERRVNERTLELAQALDEIRDSEAQLRGVAATVPGVLFQWFTRRDGTSGFYYVSPRCQELYGVSAEALVADWRNMPVHPEDWPGVMASIREAVEHDTPWFNESRALWPDGSVRWLRSRSQPVRQEDEETIFTGVILDVTAEVEARRALESSERRFRRLSQGSLQGIVVHRVDEAFTPLFANPAAARMYGFDTSEAVIAFGSVRPLMPEAVQAEAEANWPKLLDGTLPYIHTRIPALTRQGQSLTVELMGCVVEWEGAPALQLTLIDVTERERLEVELRTLASTDPLTELANRRQFMTVVEQAMAHARRHRAPISVLLLDIDYFKHLNDTHGHEVGDLALQQFAQSLRETLRASDIACRWGGEEFAVLATDAGTPGGCHVGERIRQACQALYLEHDSGEIRYTVSVGVAVVGDDEADIHAAMRRADAALYAAKQAGRNRVLFAPPDGSEPASCNRA